jgi:hypothetical protein
VSTDAELILQLTKAIREDPVKPAIDQQFNPTDPVAIEIVLHETDFAVEAYMEKWKLIYRPQFADPQVYDDFLFEYQMRARKDVKRMIAAAQRMIAEEIEKENQDEEPDDEDADLMGGT